MSGMYTSETTRSGCSRSMHSSASAPDAAPSTSIRLRSSAAPISALTVGLSSTMRIFGIRSTLGAAGRPGAVERLAAGRLALVDPDGDAEQQLLDAVVDRPGTARHEGAVLTAEVEPGIGLPLGRGDDRGEGRLSPSPEEVGVHDPPGVERDDPLPRRQRHDQGAGLPAERDR